MTMRRKLEWILIAMTGGLMILLKYLHYGVTHYNIFLLVLMVWTLVLIMSLKGLYKKGSQPIEQDKS